MAAQWPKYVGGAGSLLVGACLGVLITPALAIVGLPLGFGLLIAGGAGQLRSHRAAAPLKQRALKVATRVLRCHSQGVKEAALTVISPYGATTSAARALADTGLAPWWRKLAIRHRYTKRLHQDVRAVIDALNVAGYPDSTLAHYSTARPTGDEVRDLAYHLAYVANKITDTAMTTAPSSPASSPANPQVLTDADMNGIVEADSSYPNRVRMLLRITSQAPARYFYARVVNMHRSEPPFDEGWDIPWVNGVSLTQAIDISHPGTLLLATMDGAHADATQPEPWAPGVQFMVGKTGERSPGRKFVRPQGIVSGEDFVRKEIAIDVMVWEQASSKSITRRIELGYHHLTADNRDFSPFMEFKY